MANRNEEQLIRLAASRDRRALEELVARYQPGLYRLFLSLGAGSHQAEDLVQETLLRALVYLPCWRPRAAFSTWLYRVAHNLWRDQRCRASSRREVPGSDQLAALPAETVDQGAGVALEAERQAVQQALKTLPPEQREVVVLRFYQELSLAEIARVCNCPLNTVKSRLRLALVKLRRQLEAEHEE